MAHALEKDDRSEVTNGVCGSPDLKGIDMDIADGCYKSAVGDC